MRKLLIALLFLPLQVFAQQVDPRITEAGVKALQAEIILRDTIITVTNEEKAKREKDLADWFKAYFGEPK